MFRNALVCKIRTVFSVHSVNQSRKLSSKFGFECAVINGDYDPLFLEKSIKKGCTMILGKSGEHSGQIYDLLYDLSDDDTFDMTHYTLGHTLKLPSSKHAADKLTSNSFQVSEWKDNLDKVRRILAKRRRGLDFVTIQLPLLQCISPTDDVASLVCEFQEYFKESFSDSLLIPSVTKLGLDLDTNFFVSSTDVTEDKLIAILQPLVDGNKIGALTIASNCMTYPLAQGLLKWGKGQGLLTVATEVMRAHHTRPGLLPVNFQHMTIHSPIKDPSQTKETHTAPRSAVEREKRCVAEIVKATEDLNMALDRCMSMEKKYLTELLLSSPKASAVDARTVCVANKLAHMLNLPNSSQVLYVDEWTYHAAKQIEPEFNESSARLVRVSQALGDYISLYKTMFKYLMSSFRNMLQTKTLLLSQNAQDIILRHFPSLKSDDGLESISKQMAVLAAGSTGADFVTMSFTQVNSTEWQELWDKKIEELAKQPEFRDNAKKTFKELNTLLLEYNN